MPDCREWWLDDEAPSLGHSPGALRLASASSASFFFASFSSSSFFFFSSAAAASRKVLQANRFSAPVIQED